MLKILYKIIKTGKKNYSVTLNKSKEEIWRKILKCE